MDSLQVLQAVTYIFIATCLVAMIAKFYFLYTDQTALYRLANYFWIATLAGIWATTFIRLGIQL